MRVDEQFLLDISDGLYTLFGLVSFYIQSHSFRYQDNLCRWDRNKLWKFGEVLSSRNYFHVPSVKVRLHSHGVKFGMGGIYSVTGYAVDDHGSYWQLNEKINSKTKTLTDVIKCGDSITVRSAIIDYFLRT